MSSRILMALALTFTSTLAFANKYSTQFENTTVEECPALPPDQFHIVRPTPPTNACAGKGTSIFVSSAYRTLFLCENDQVVETYDVALGSKGVGKTMKDDRKTPIGTYALGAARESDKFGLFIPVGYPTKAQREKGFTGEAIGIHGPARQFRCYGFLNVAIDWTAGCMAVADDGFIARIANWVSDHPKANITIK